MTTLQTVYDAFFALITDDLYLELTEEQTRKDCRELLSASLPLFEFPRKVIEIDGDTFNRELTLEEQNILAMGMLQLWTQRQVTSIENIRQKFSGPDFKISSQAAHLQQLQAVWEQAKTEHRRLQMLYSRRRTQNDEYESTFRDIRWRGGR